MILYEFSVKSRSDHHAFISALEGLIVTVDLGTKEEPYTLKGRLAFVGHTLIEGIAAMTYALINDDSSPSSP